MEPAGRNPFGQMPLQEPVSTTTKQPPKLPDSNTSQETSSGPPKLPGETPFTANQLQADQLRLQVESSLSISEVKAPTPTPAISKQIEIINSVMKVGIITKLRAKELGIGIIQSADRDQSPSDRLCLNYIHTQQGKTTSLEHPSKGGLPVVIERENDQLGTKPINDTSLLQELSERAHCSMLFVIPIKKAGPNDAILNLVKADGKEFVDKRTYISNNSFGCMEARANGSIPPDSLVQIILPEKLKPFSNLLNVNPERLIFVPSKEVKVPYNIGSQIKGLVTISCPDYNQGLQRFSNAEIFTHMLRSPTNQELG